MRSILCFFILLQAFIVKGQDSLSNVEITTALQRVNRARREAGLDTVILSAKLSDGCLKHAQYLVINKGNKLTNGLAAHNEHKTLKGYSVQGEVAGRSSVIAFARPSEAVGMWLRSFYHRIPLLQPGLKEIGVAFYEKDDYTVCLLNCVTGSNRVANKGVVYCPNSGQREVPLQMGLEIPDPVTDEDKDSPYGFPVTIYFASELPVKNVVFTLTNGDMRTVPCYLSTPEKPATSFTQWNTVCAIPQKPLLPSTQYIVTISCTVDGVAFKKSYSFYTGKEN